MLTKIPTAYTILDTRTNLLEENVLYRDYQQLESVLKRAPYNIECYKIVMINIVRNSVPKHKRKGVT